MLSYFCEVALLGFSSMVTNFVSHFVSYKKLTMILNNNLLNVINTAALFIITYTFTIFLRKINLNNKKLENYILVVVFLLATCNENYFLFFRTLLEINQNFLNDSNVNKSLGNPLVSIHPILTQWIYISLILLCIKFGCDSYLKIKDTLTKKKKFSQKTDSTKTLMSLLKIALVVIFLGSWWAAQELTWNNWWNWDLIENITILLLFIFVDVVHKLKLHSFLCTKNIYLKSILGVSLTTFLLVRYDLSNSLHTFNSFEFVEINIVTLLACGFIMISYMFKSKQYDFFHFKSLITLTISVKEKDVKIHQVVFKILCVLSFFFCINSFIIAALSLNVKNEMIKVYVFFYETTLVSTLFVYTTNFSNKLKKKIVYLAPVFPINYLLILDGLLAFKLINKYKIKKYHTILFILLFGVFTIIKVNLIWFDTKVPNVPYFFEKKNLNVLKTTILDSLSMSCALTVKNYNYYFNENLSNFGLLSEGAFFSPRWVSDTTNSLFFNNNFNLHSMIKLNESMLIFSDIEFSTVLIIAPLLLMEKFNLLLNKINLYIAY